MSPRKADPTARATLIEIGARLLHEEGPQTLSTRRIAAEAGSSTMAVYTHFGGMDGLVREIVHEGFARLEKFLTQVRESDDPVADMAVLGRAYRANALANPHLYTVMFGGESLGGFELTDEDRQYGRYTLTTVINCATRCVASGRFRAGDPVLVSHHMWLATHGLINLELGDYLIDPWNADTCYETQLVTLMVGEGDSLEAATRSVELSAERFRTEVEHGPHRRAGKQQT
ncbi:MAG TPA: TetR/AcrR family transcriptional regulator [Actinophytocola sp.]|uniref:TetR/AcrR family transcriptional regulator n=1 Tax=Actinophytocola sp. TaxID=1872138 RepID=UPI002E0216DE|nr:TetR/AcrR family transcriptional regulator [Actinophytocola sp.]